MKRSLLIRIDDICPTMNFNEFKRATDILDSYGLKPLIGVIPDCKDPDLDIQPKREDFWQFVKQLQQNGYAVAMHGFHHVFDSPHHGIVNRRLASEFAGHSLEVQVEKIRKGKEILNLHGIQTDTFFAPAHSYDDNTLRALKICGFKYLSDGKSRKPYERCGIICLPCRATGVTRIYRGGLQTAVIHTHEWVQPSKKIEYEAFELFCKQHKDEVVTFDQYANSPTGNKLIQRIDEKFFLMWEFYIRPHVLKLIRIIRKHL